MITRTALIAILLLSGCASWTGKDGEAKAGLNLAAWEQAEAQGQGC